jgi:hypothetical protein
MDIIIFGGRESGVKVVSVETPWLIYIWSLYRHGVFVHWFIKGVEVWDLFDLILFQVPFKPFWNDFSTYKSQ